MVRVPGGDELNTQKAGIAIDEWKLPIFERHLRQSGYAFENAGPLAFGTLLLRVDTNNLEALRGVLEAAHDEAKQTGAPHA